MRGQKLFVRPIEAADHDAVRRPRRRPRRGQRLAKEADRPRNARRARRARGENRQGLADRPRRSRVLSSGRFRRKWRFEEEGEAMSECRTCRRTPWSLCILHSAFCILAACSKTAPTPPPPPAAAPPAVTVTTPP